MHTKEYFKDILLYSLILHGCEKIIIKNYILVNGALTICVVIVGQCITVWAVTSIALSHLLSPPAFHSFVIYHLRSSFKIPLLRILWDRFEDIHAHSENENEKSCFSLRFAYSLMTNSTNKHDQSFRFSIIIYIT